MKQECQTFFLVATARSHRTGGSARYFFIEFQDLLLVISIDTHYGEHDHIHRNSNLLLAADFDELKLSNPLSSYLVQVAAHNLYNGHRL